MHLSHRALDFAKRMKTGRCTYGTVLEDLREICPRTGRQD
ncbi:hypothetical protein RUMTOR_00188 [[Ruminococcus] torques ATCC 27756]|uniref:Uncharacterized protein n=1 Tax=[Ruminococcus] torques ATCC 27756 TaxID=411460 RepID=A5KIZ3_9FIRM|nr:hypothetical protein RUMTOR_00188 [[Ruminococcus] torques ATCC 27756]